MCPLDGGEIQLVNFAAMIYKKGADFCKNLFVQFKAFYVATIKLFLLKSV